MQDDGIVGSVVEWVLPWMRNRMIKGEIWDRLFNPLRAWREASSGWGIDSRKGRKGRKGRQG